MSCGYQGKSFVAHYEDAACFDGYLWDLDSCDEPGGPLYHGGDIPCPACNTREYVAWLCPAVGGNSRQRRRRLRRLEAMIAQRVSGGGAA